MSDRIAFPEDKGNLVILRKRNGMKNSSIEVDGSLNIVPRGIDAPNASEYTLVARKSTRSGGISSRANALKACKGLSGCEFVECSYEAFGKIPSNLEKACPTFVVDDYSLVKKTDKTS